MISVLNIILFLIYTYGLGYSLTRFDKSQTFELFVMRIGLGLGAFVSAGVLFNFLKIGIDWKIFLLLSLCLPAFDIIRSGKLITILPQIRLPKINWRIIFLLLIIIFCIICYFYGPFTYQWLEDDDPWNHAAGIKYISTEHNINVPSGIFQYINPYPPGYDLLFGVLHQTSPSLYWTLKFFNGLIIVLSIAFFYFFIKQFTGNSDKALFSAFFLAAIPCYLSHFIWAHSLAVTLFFPAFYFILKSKEDKRFSIPAAIAIAGILLTQPTQSVKFIIMMILLYLSFYITEKKLNKQWIFIPIGAILFSLIWYGGVIKEYRSKKLTLMTTSGTTQLKRQKNVGKIISGILSPKGGTATRKYTVSDYFRFPEYSPISAPVGVGVIIFFLALLRMLIILDSINKNTNKQNPSDITILGWLAFTFLGCNSMTFKLPIGLFAFRFWALFAIPVSMLAGDVIHEWLKALKKPFNIVLLIILVFSVCMTSVRHKLTINTHIWSPGIWWKSKKEMHGYVWMRHNLKPGTKVFAFQDNKFVIGHDMHSDFWSSKYQESFKNAMDLDPLELSSELKDNAFEYIIVGNREIRKYGQEIISRKIEAIKNSGLFALAYEDNNNVWIFRVL